jgi:hypothetical protein
VSKVTREDWPSGEARPDEIGVSPALSPKYPVISVPYGALVPKTVDGLLVAGRTISCDATSHSFLHEIPQCWMTGQAAGVAAAMAAGSAARPSVVPVANLQEELTRQGVLLRVGVTV